METCSTRETSSYSPQIPLLTHTSPPLSLHPHENKHFTSRKDQTTPQNKGHGTVPFSAKSKTKDLRSVYFGKTIPGVIPFISGFGPGIQLVFCPGRRKRLRNLTDLSLVGPGLSANGARHYEKNEQQVSQNALHIFPLASKNRTICPCRIPVGRTTPSDAPARASKPGIAARTGCCSPPAIPSPALANRSAQSGRHGGPF